MMYIRNIFLVFNVVVLGTSHTICPMFEYCKDFPLTCNSIDEWVEQKFISLKDSKKFMTLLGLQTNKDMYQELADITVKNDDEFVICFDQLQNKIDKLRGDPVNGGLQDTYCRQFKQAWLALNEFHGLLESKYNSIERMILEEGIKRYKNFNDKEYTAYITESGPLSKLSDSELKALMFNAVKMIKNDISIYSKSCLQLIEGILQKACPAFEQGPLEYLLLKDEEVAQISVDKLRMNRKNEWKMRAFSYREKTKLVAALKEHSYWKSFEEDTK